MSLPPNDPQRRDDAVPPAGAAEGTHAAHAAGAGPVGGGARQDDEASVDVGGHAAHAANAVPVDQGASATAPAHVGAHRAPPRGQAGGGLSRTTWLLIAGGVVVLAVIVGLFFAGLRVGSGGEATPAAIRTSATSGSAEPDASVTPTPTEATAPTTPAAAADAAPAGPLAPGVHDWNALHGGECLTGYTSPWELQFTVADCAGDHNAQLVSKGAFAEDAAAPFPGEAELVSRLNLLCTAPTVLDYAVAGAVPDLQWQGAYPANDAQWAAGDRAYFCFFSRTSGEPLGGSLAVPPAG